MLCNWCLWIFLELFSIGCFYLICSLGSDLTSSSWINLHFLCLQGWRLAYSSTGRARTGRDLFFPLKRLFWKALRFTHFCLGSVDTRSSEVDTRPSFQQISLPDWDSRSTLDQVRSTLVPGSVDTIREPIHFQKKIFGGQTGFSISVSISRSCKPSFQEEGQGNQGESLERRLLCKAREQIQLKKLRRRRISGISDAIKAEHRQLRRISIDFHQASSIEFGVVVLQVVLESSCSRVFGVVVLRCELYSSTFQELKAFCILSRKEEFKWVYKIRTQASVGSKTSLISKLRSLAAIHCKWIQDIGCARLEMIGEHSVDTRSSKVDTRPSFQQISLPDWDSRSTLDQAREPIHFQKKIFSGQTGFSRSVSISRSCKPSFQEEGQGNQGESLERRLLCKAREQIQLKKLRRRRISGISDAIKAEHRQLRRIFIDFHQASSIESLFFLISFCTVSHRALVCESSHSLCGLSRRAQFGVVVLQVVLESSCSGVSCTQGFE
ncbi:hypothetical protein Taro_021685 [Colocasia esculenta]|uniref:Uncharacterized protein n=1 Tax=Colocasia esculenta TaxID=4460 RepID=A0A843V8X7_COLES|nr:hypothetical protein [Colocasia esculenta]